MIARLVATVIDFMRPMFGLADRIGLLQGRRRTVAVYFAYRLGPDVVAGMRRDDHTRLWVCPLAGLRLMSDSVGQAALDPNQTDVDWHDASKVLAAVESAKATDPFGWSVPYHRRVAVGRKGGRRRRPG